MPSIYRFVALALGLAAASLPLSRPAHAQVASIQTLGSPPPGFSQISSDVRVSGNGQVVVGTVFDGSPQEAFRWTQATGLVPLGGAPGGFSSSSANCVSFDGSVIGGSVTNNTLGVSHAMRWTSTGGMQSLGRLPGGSSGGFAMLTACSDDGSVMVGSSGWFSGGSNFGQEAIKWTQAGGMVSLGDLPGGSFYCFATGVSGSGATITGVGTSSNVSGPNGEGFIISGADPMTAMGALNSTPFDSQPQAVSADGNVVVGAVIAPGTTFSYRVPFRYTAATGYQVLSPSDPFYNIGWARATNADGSVVVGYIANSSTSNSSRAFVWTQSAGVRLLDALLTEQGANLSAWQSLTEATGVSADGLTIVGYGRLNSSPSQITPFYARLTKLPCPGRWTRIAPPVGPAARSGHAVAWDSHRGVLVVFGGDVGGAYSNQTWEWNGQSWTLRSTSGPSSRVHSVAAYDPVRRRTVLFGGRGSGTTMFDETWEWDGLSWTLRSLPNRPSARSVCGMVYDSARARMVLFGGVSPSVTALGETWEYDGTTWTLRSSGGPQPREWPGMAYDSARQLTVMFGGSSTSGVAFNETWEWNGASGTWTFRNIPGPSERSLKNLAYDAARGVVVCFGGYGSGAFRADHWEYDGTAWTQRTLAMPTPRFSHPLVYDPAQQRVLFFGGEAQSGLTAETWSFSNARWKPVSGPQLPRYRANGLLAVAPGEQGLVLYGGTSDTPATAAMNDTWLHTSGVWGEIRPINSPLTGLYALAACDRVSTGQLRPFLFGGLSATQVAQRNSYEFDGQSWLATSINTGPSARHSTRVVFDSSNSRVLLFGGRTGGTALGDLWKWEFGQWSPIVASGPSPRYEHAMAYDAARQRVVLFGGRVGDQYFGDTWEFNVVTNTWSFLSDLNPAPPARCNASMVYDPVRQRVVMFGGFNGSTALNEVWEFDGANWHLAASQTGPSVRYDAFAAYDPWLQRIVVFGGNAGSSYFNDTWLYAGPPTVSVTYPILPRTETVALPGEAVTLAVQVVVSDGLPVQHEWAFEHIDYIFEPLYPPPGRAPEGVLANGDRAGRVSGATTTTLSIASVDVGDTGYYTLITRRGCDVLSTRRFGVGVKCNAADVTYIGGSPEPPSNTYFPPDGQLTVDDLIGFVNSFADGAGCPAPAPCNVADVCGIGGLPEPSDGQLTVDDIIQAVNSYIDGCP